MIPGIILAGGLARRLGGGDKALLAIGGVTILDRIVAALEPQCRPLILNANGDPRRFGTRLPVVPDSVGGNPGPLAGVLAGLDWLAGHAPDARYAVTVPSDTPFLPADLVRRLSNRQAATGVGIVHASSGGRSHFTVALWSLALRDTLRSAVVEAGMRKVGAFFEAQNATCVEWEIAPCDPFLNINTPLDRKCAEDIAARCTR